MKIHFKHGVKLDGKFYPKGQHELDDQLGSHWFIKGLVKSGDAVIADEPIKAGEPKSEAQPESSDDEADSKDGEASESEPKAEQGKSKKSKKPAPQPR